ncbi:hypothetical protein [Streptomyces virginiae]|uniref:hypothetical protein n=1 Tax=Streptomyces virginiae TaxID=1961 RepID=UPI00342720CE
MSRSAGDIAASPGGGAVSRFGPLPGRCVSGEAAASAASRRMSAMAAYRSGRAPPPGTLNSGSSSYACFSACTQVARASASTVFARWKLPPAASWSRSASSRMSSTSIVASARKSRKPVVARMSSHRRIGSAARATLVTATPLVSMSAASARSVCLPLR